MAISKRPQFVVMANFKATKSLPKEYTWQQKKHFYKQTNHYSWDEPYLFKISSDGLIRMCIVGKEARDIIWQCHNSNYRGRHSGRRTTTKVLQNGFLWLTVFKDCKSYVLEYLEFQKIGNISK